MEDILEILEEAFWEDGGDADLTTGSLIDFP